jgi:hypothetical protein
MENMKKLSDHPAYTLTDEKYFQAVDKLSKDLRKAGIAVELLDEVVISTMKLTKQWMERRFGYIPVYTPEELAKRVRAGEEF